jgi:hypothetical protein
MLGEIRHRPDDACSEVQGMLRKLIAAGFIALAVASCGSGSATPSPSASASGSAPASAGAGAPSAAPGDTSSVAPSMEAPSATVPDGTMTAACDAVALRRKAATTGGLVARLKIGTTIHVAETLEGSAYTPGACGVAGTSWLKIDQVGGKTVKALYGTQFLYAAAGLFQ